MEEQNIQKEIIFNGESEDIKRITSILIDNATKHTNEKSKIIVEKKKKKNEILLFVRNEGEAIPKEEQEKIFERFYRVDKARNRNEKRYGLGLAIARQTLEKYKGTISVSFLILFGNHKALNLQKSLTFTIPYKTLSKTKMTPN